MATKAKKKTTPRKPAPPKTAPKATASTAKKIAPKKKAAQKAAPKKAVVKKAVTKKATVKKAAVKKVTSKKKAAQKAAPKKAVVKKAVAKKETVKKAAVKKVTPKKKAAQKAAPKKAAAPHTQKRHLPPPPPPPPRRSAAKKKAKPFTKKELAIYRELLQHQLERMQKNLDALAADNLKRTSADSTGDISFYSTHMADHGTDNFDRELALNLVSGRQESIYDIEYAIRRIDEGIYGFCDSCEQMIERARLKALPFAKKCLACQNAAERGRTKYRPFDGASTLQRFSIEDMSGSEPAD